MRRSRAACAARVRGARSITRTFSPCAHTHGVARRKVLAQAKTLPQCMVQLGHDFQDFACCRLVGALALCACANAAAETHDDAADSMAKVLAGVTFLKELGNFQNAQHAMSIFGKVADAHISEARCVASRPHASTCLTTLFVCVFPSC